MKSIFSSAYSLAFCSSLGEAYYFANSCMKYCFFLFQIRFGVVLQFYFWDLYYFNYLVVFFLIAFNFFLCIPSFLAVNSIIRFSLLFISFSNSSIFLVKSAFTWSSIFLTSLVSRAVLCTVISLERIDLAIWFICWSNMFVFSTDSSKSLSCLKHL